MIPFLETILTKVTASFLIKIVKDKLIGDKGEHYFYETISDTIDFYNKEGIELKRDYFISILEDESVKLEVENFYNGIDYVSLETLSNAFMKSDFYMISKEDIRKYSLDIMKFFIESLKRKLLSDPYTASLFLNTVIANNFRQTNSFVEELKNNTKLYLNSISINLIKIENKQDLVLDTQGLHSQLLNQILASVKNTDEIKSDVIEFRNKFKQANELFNKGKYETAREIYLELLQAKEIDNEDKWRLNRNIAMSYLITNNQDKAVPYYMGSYNVFPNEDKGKLQKIYADMITQGYEFALKEFEELYGEKHLSDEEITLKMNLLVKSGKPNEALNLFEPLSIVSMELQYAYGHLLFELKRYNEATDVLHKVVEANRKPEFLLELGVCIVVPIIDQLQNEKYAKINLPENLIKGLEYAKTLIEESIEKFSRTESRMEYASAIFNRGVVNSLLSLTYDGLQDFQQAKALGMTGIQLYLNLGFSYIRNSDFDKAIIELRNAYNIEPEIALSHLLEALLFNNEYDEIKKILIENEHIKYPNIELQKGNIHYYLMLCLVLERELSTIEVDKILAVIDEKYANEFEVIYKKSRIMWQRGFTQSTIEYLQTKIELVTSGKEILKMKLADYYYELKNWDKALEEYKNFYTLDNSFEIKYVNCLYNLKRDEELLDITREILDKGSIGKNGIKELRANTLFMTENFVDALPLFKELAINTAKNYFYLYWALCEFRLSNEAEALKVLVKAEKDFQDNPRELGYISQTYFNINEKQKGIELSYRLARENPEDEELNSHFVNQMLMSTKLVKYITEEMKKLFNDLLNNWEATFPESHLFRKMEFDPDLKDLKLMLTDKEQYGKQLISMYERKQIPFALLTYNCSYSLYEVWKDLTNAYQFKIWATNPSTLSMQLLNTNSEAIVIEPLALFTLFSLNMQNILQNLFKNIYFTQGFLDDLNTYKNELGLHTTRDRLTMMNIDGNLISIKTTVEEIRVEKKIIESMIAFVHGHIGGNTKSFVDKRIVGMLSQAATQSVNLSLEKDVSMYSDDAILCDLMYSENNLKYFSTTALLNRALSDKVISVYEYNKGILKLININYNFIPLNAFTLVQEIDNSPLKEKPSILKAIDTFHELNRDKDKDFIVIAEFVMQLYDKKISELIKTQWIDYILNAATINSDKKEEILSNISNKISEYILKGVSLGNINSDSANKFDAWYKKVFATWILLKK